MKVRSLLSGDSAPLQLTKALLIYDQPEREADYLIADVRMLEQGAELSTPLCFVSLHEVYEEHQSKRPFIGPGQPLERARLDELLRRLAQSEAAPKRELLSANLLFADTSMLVWHAPAQRRAIYFSTAEKEFDHDVTGKVVAHPALLFKATPSMLSVWALETDARPTVQTPLFIGPYCNLYHDGSMCRGDMKLPPTITPSSIPAWEAIFYDSRFTHTNLRGKMTAHDGDHNGLWREMLGADAFDTKYLLPAQKTVEEVLK